MSADGYKKLRVMNESKLINYKYNRIIKIQNSN